MDTKIIKDYKNYKNYKIIIFVKANIFFDKKKFRWSRFQLKVCTSTHCQKSTTQIWLISNFTALQSYGSSTINNNDLLQKRITLFFLCSLISEINHFKKTFIKHENFFSVFRIFKINILPTNSKWLLFSIFLRVFFSGHFFCFSKKNKLRVVANSFDNNFS